MSSVVISGDTSGAITVAAPAVAGTNTLTLPALTGTALLASSLGTAGQILSSNGASSLPSWGAVTAPSGTLSYIASGNVTGTATADVTNIGSFSSLYIIAYSTYSTTSARNLTVAVSSNNGSSFGTAAQISAQPNTSSVFSLATISNTNVIGNKTISPTSLTLLTSSTLYTTTATETSITGTINALRFSHTGSTIVSIFSVFGIT